MDNLIAICVSCHSDVHSNTKLTRRFSVKELQLHRENVYRLIAEGKLPSSSSDTLTSEEVSASVIRRLKGENGEDNFSGIGLSVTALDVLLSAVTHKAPIQIRRPESHDQWEIPFQVHVGEYCYLPKTNLSANVLYPDFIVELVSAKLLKGNADELFVTEAGYAFADDILSTNPSFTMIKVECRKCMLHFIVCTWYPDQHSASTLHCPECGQHEGNFVTDYQKMFGFIFQVVPGSGQLIGGSTICLRRKGEGQPPTMDIYPRGT